LSEIVYSTTVTAVGELVPDFADQGVLVFFGETPAQATIIGGTIVLVSITAHIVWGSRDTR
jgi:sorbitol-specific phosphotransferase system component IIA